ncbi:glycosyl transferase [Agaricicola taiwanensis]|uniref:Glycosyl transferase n=1 Tax=Agaricicola taiwanensis TaxID=591372 RepID=A0A8J2YIJ1_9RHOB|nr:glycosyltransferase family 39 protein [Agaricicola taiwanensis]GGE45164.1 glycosyl transferase [Agaricicola taiwanensis]
MSMATQNDIAAAAGQEEGAHPSPTVASTAEDALNQAVRKPFLKSALLILLVLAACLPGLLTVPPIDRDEARFAQATKQMVETRDFIDIRFQDEARHKKPVGIYWLQTAAVSIGEAMGVDDARRQIWLYRLPSQLGAILAVVALAWAGVPLVGRRAAFIGAAGLALTILMGVEARLAKTDAMLLGLIILSQGVLARAYVASHGGRLSLSTSILFWLALGLGILIKGPMAPFVVGMTALFAAIFRKEGRWLLALRPILGLLLALAVAAPWFIAIALQSKGAFFEESVGQDFIGKLLQGQESHGAPPGVYTLIAWGTLWPVSPFLLLALPTLWAWRRERAMLFLIAWAVPAWLVLELIPTKLPHYMLPLVPALMLATGRWLVDGPPKLNRALLWPAVALLLLGSVGVPLAAIAAGYAFDGIPSFGQEPFAVLTAGLGVWAAMALWNGHRLTSFVRIGVASLTLYAGVYGFAFPELRALWVSSRLAAAAEAVPCGDPVLATTGFREPSLVFLTRTDLEMTDGAGAARFLAAGGCRVAFVESREEGAFDAARGGLTPAPRLLTRVKGINLNGGRQLDIAVYTTAEKQ